MRNNAYPNSLKTIEFETLTELSCFIDLLDRRKALNLQKISKNRSWEETGLNYD